MSYWDESYEERQDRRRQERREYEADAYYEAWRSGVDTDRVTYERMEDAYYDGLPPESVANQIRREDRLRQEMHEQQEMMEAEYHQQQEEHRHDVEDRGGGT